MPRTPMELLQFSLAASEREAAKETTTGGTAFTRQAARLRIELEQLQKTKDSYVPGPAPQSDASKERKRISVSRKRKKRSSKR